jgi:hypothetical protein
MTRNLRFAVILVVALAALSFASVALAQENYPPKAPPGEVLSDSDVKGSAEDSGVLPFTGGNLVLFVALGAGLIVVGATVHRRGRGAAAPS